MQEVKINDLGNASDASNKFLLVALGLMGLAVFMGLLYLMFDGDFSIGFPDAYILPWTLLPFSAIAATWAYLIYTKKFHFFHPLVFCSWLYFIPAFVGGGVILAAGWSQPYYLVFIQNPRYDIPLSLCYIALGYLCLSIGYFLPYGNKLGAIISNKLPEWDWTPKQLLMPSMILLALGFSFNISALFSGLLGFQKLEQIGTFDALQYFLTLIIVEASLILWMVIFRSPKLDFNLTMVLILLIALIPIRMLVLGSRSSLVASVIMIAAAFLFSGKKLSLKHGVLLVVFLIASIMGGVIYGTTFRYTKGTQDRVSMEEYFDNISKTISKLGTQDSNKTLSEGFYALSERVDGLSSLAVVVSNYEKLTPYEASIGLDNHIWNYTWTAFIPRFLWDDKPIVSDARGYGELYFNYGENSFAINVVGDLLRNFGPVGVPLGMLLLGMFVRVIYASLIENANPTVWRVMTYYMILIIINYEGFYGAIVPLVMRVTLIAFLSLILLRLLIGKDNKQAYA